MRVTGARMEGERGRRPLIWVGSDSYLPLSLGAQHWEPLRMALSSQRHSGPEVSRTGLLGVFIPLLVCARPV